jgi:DNA polymerase-4
MDCFYAAVHQRDDPTLRGKPVIIGGSPNGRGVVAAASYEVRRFGVRSAMPSSRAVRLCPHAVFIKPEFHRYQAESARVFEIFRRFTEVIQPVSIDEAYLDVTEVYPAWGTATALAREIRRQVKEELNLTVSIGVGPNRLVAKIASDHDKPDGLTVVPPARVLEFLAPLNVRALQGVGPATARTLQEAFSVTTVAQLRELSSNQLSERLGSYGRVLYDYSRGIDGREVKVDRVRKSLSAERTYSQDIVEIERMQEEIARLAHEVSKGLERRELSGSTVTAKVRYEDFTTVTRSATLKGPTRSSQVLTKVGLDLLHKTQAGQRAVRLLGLGVSKLHGASSDDPQLELDFEG